MKTDLTLLAVAAMLAFNTTNAQTPVDPATFAGHYYTEEEMKIDKGGAYGGKKKSHELDMTFEAAKGTSQGVSPVMPDKRDKLTFYADVYAKRWAEDSKIWVLDNNNMNGRCIRPHKTSILPHF